MPRIILYPQLTKVVSPPVAETANSLPVFSKFSQPLVKAVSIAVISGIASAPFVPTTPTVSFSSFSQPVSKRYNQLDLPTTVLNPPVTAVFQPYLFSNFSQPIPNRSINVSLLSWSFVPPLAPQVTVLFDPFVKKKRKKRDGAEDYLDEKVRHRAKLREDIEFAIHGPPVEYKYKPQSSYVAPNVPDSSGLASVILALENERNSQKKRQAAEQDDADAIKYLDDSSEREKLLAEIEELKKVLKGLV